MVTLTEARAALEHACLTGQLERARLVLLLLLTEGASPRLVERAIGRVARLRADVLRLEVDGIR